MTKLQSIVLLLLRRQGLVLDRIMHYIFIERVLLVRVCLEMPSKCLSLSSQRWKLGPKASQCRRCLQRFGCFPSNTQAPTGPESLQSERAASRGLASEEPLHVHHLHPLRAALLMSTAARFSRQFDQQVCLYIHKLTPLDLRSPAPAYLLRMRNLRRSFFGECRSLVLLGGDRDSWKWEGN